MSQYIAPHDIRSRFVSALAGMYSEEVPQYRQLKKLVSDINLKILQDKTAENPTSSHNDSKEQHGAIRLGTAEELGNMRRLFAIMAMHPVDYYDLSVAGIPVHSTAFRPTTQEEIKQNSFRVFTSLLRLEFISDKNLKQTVQAILKKRHIMSASLLKLITKAEQSGGLTEDEVSLFIQEGLNVFRWQQSAIVDKQTYHKLQKVHPLVADIVCFPGPHINHLTPGSLDIDTAQAEMIKQGLDAKAVIEGPPGRICPILLRQTSFNALNETIQFKDGSFGKHRARFGEIEQRGVALTPKGRSLYDELLLEAKSHIRTQLSNDGDEYSQCLQQAFAQFPDSHTELRQQGLAFYDYQLSNNLTTKPMETNHFDLEQLIQTGVLEATPIRYEDFLPISAAGIFKSNLQTEAEHHKKNTCQPSRKQFEQDLGCEIIDSMGLYKERQEKSLDKITQCGCLENRETN